MAALSLSRRFAAWRVSWLFFFFSCGAVFSPLQVAIYICKRQFPNNHVPHCGETNQIQCNRPHDTATCYFHTAFSLGRSQSVLTQVERISEPNTECYRVSLLSPATCWFCETWVLRMAVGPAWRTNASRCRTIPRRCIWQSIRLFFLDLHINVGDAVLYHYLKSSSSDRQRTHLSIFPWKAFVACRGIREGFSGPLPPLRSRLKTADRRDLSTRIAWER